MLEMCRYADENGFAGVVLSEHHGSEDGFMSAPLVVAAGVWERPATCSVRFRPSCCRFGTLSRWPRT
ncbi:MAG: hypothetical protein CM1200mP26_12360 [Acidimicrobiales bacterium]|nr:MAG: hypothetical protein CM1200mP26_12360 [Acidimicrobiales bacterium]